MCGSIIGTILQVGNALAQGKLKGLILDPALRLQLLRFICNNSILPEIIKAGIEFCRPTTDELRAAEVFKLLARNGYLDLMKWLQSTFELNKGDAINAFLYGACDRFDSVKALDTARWLVEHFQITKEDFVEDGCFIALSHACRGGHLKLAQWLVEKYELTSTEIHQGDEIVETPIGQACINGHISVLRWLVDTYDFELDDMFYIFIETCRTRHLNICKYLAETYQFSKDEVRDGNHIIKNCYHPDIRDWLMDTYYDDSPVMAASRTAAVADKLETIGGKLNVLDSNKLNE
jgi:hypothetical protein